MPASRGTTGGRDTTLGVMILFIVLFLIAAIFAVFQFMNNEQLRNDRSEALARFDELATSNEYNIVKPLIRKRGLNVQSTALSQITADLRYLAELIAGEELTDFDLVGARDMIDQRLNNLKSQANIALSSPQGEPYFEFDREDGRFMGLENIVKALIDEVLLTRQDNDRLDEEKNNLGQKHQQELQQLSQRIVQLDNDLAVASQAAQIYNANYNKLELEQSARYEQIIESLNEQIASNQNQLEQTQQQYDTLNQQTQNFQTEVIELRDILRLLRPNPDTEMPALEPDGYVISVVPRDRLAYINLNRDNHIYRGLTFTVYDSFAPISKTGQGKGSLEVIEIMENVSKCRITDYDPTNPIMEKDIIANLIWSLDKKYLFCVSGEFDFNQDGSIDSDGRDRVIGLIEAWGGVASPGLTVDTDFLVLGHPPVLPLRPSEEELESNTDAAVAFLSAQQGQLDYQQVFSNSDTLGVPTFNLERFLYFIGYYQQAKSPL